MPFFGVPIRNGVPIGLGSVAGFGISPFDPSQLFSAGEQGAWYDPSDLSTMFNDAAGTQPITSFTTNQPVGLLLDKSKGLVLGPELVTNPGPFANTTGWTGSNATIASVNGALQITHTTGVAGFSANQAFNVTAGKCYKLSTKGRVVSGTSTVFQIAFRSTSDAGTSAFLGGFLINNPVTGVTYEGSAYYYATSTTTVYLHCRGFFSSAPVLEYDFANVTEVAGNHATASGSARPVLSKRYNLLLATTTLATQNVTTVATSYTLRFTGAGSITLSGTATGTLNAGTHTVTATAGTLTLTVTGTVTDADLRRTIDANAFQPAYQRVVTATDYDGDGFLPYLDFGGTQAMATGSIDFSSPGIDKMSVWAGVTKFTPVGTANRLIELSSAFGSNNGTLTVSAPDAGATEYAFGSRGTANAIPLTNSATYAAPITNVVAGLGDISGDSAILRLNGAQIDSSAADQGTGNYGNYPLYIGARGGTSQYFTGRMYSLIVRGAQSSAAQISATESWVAGKTGVAL